MRPGKAFAPVAAAFALAALLRPAPAPAAAERRALERLPRVMLWSWERPEDLSFLDGRRFGVAFLAATLTLAGDHAVARPRSAPLRVAADVPRLAVVRIESSRARPPSLSAAQRHEALAALLQAARAPRGAGLQVDFDATRRERGFYGALLADLRAALPDSLGVSITALASWCDGDRWLSGLPVDECVPMLFRMGRDEPGIGRRLERGGEFPAPECGAAIGVSLDERRFVPGRSRVYVFSPIGWTARGVTEAAAWIGR